MRCWLGAQAAWLGTAFLLQFRGRPVFVELWVAGAAFFAAHLGLVLACIRARHEKRE